MLFDFNESMKKGLIRKTIPSRGKARKSLEASLKWLEESEKNFQSNALRSSVLQGKTLIFCALAFCAASYTR